MAFQKLFKNKKAYDEQFLWPIFSQYIRLRDSDSKGIGRCITCGRPLHWTSGDCGHGIPRQHKATKYDEKNNHLQCKKCNGFEGGVREVYKEEVDKRYGFGTWDELQIRSRNVSKMGKFEYDLLIAKYTAEVERLRATKTI